MSTAELRKLVRVLRDERARAQAAGLPRTALAIDHAIWVLRAELAKKLPGEIARAVSS